MSGSSIIGSGLSCGKIRREISPGSWYSETGVPGSGRFPLLFPFFFGSHPCVFGDSTCTGMHFAMLIFFPTPLSALTQPTLGLCRILAFDVECGLPVINYHFRILLGVTLTGDPLASASLQLRQLQALTCTFAPFRQSL